MYVRMKTRIGEDAASALLVHTASGARGNLAEGNRLLHGEEVLVFGDPGYQGIDKRLAFQANVTWHIVMCLGKRGTLDKAKVADVSIDQVKMLKEGIPAKVEHTFRAKKSQYGHEKARYRWLSKSTAQLITLFALFNLWMVRGKSMRAAA